MQHLQMTYAVHWAVSTVRCINGGHVDAFLVQTHLSNMQPQNIQGGPKKVSHDQMTNKSY